MIIFAFTCMFSYDCFSSAFSTWPTRCVPLVWTWLRRLSWMPFFMITFTFMITLAFTWMFNCSLFSFNGLAQPFLLDLLGVLSWYGCGYEGFLERPLLRHHPLHRLPCHHHVQLRRYTLSNHRNCLVILLFKPLVPWLDLHIYIPNIYWMRDNGSNAVLSPHTHTNVIRKILFWSILGEFHVDVESIARYQACKL